MTPHAPLQSSNDLTRSDRESARDLSACARRKETDPLLEQLERLTQTLRQAPKDTPPAIDRLLFAVARQDEQLQHEAGRHSGEIGVALDAITRWIGNAERRFSALEENGIHDQRLIARGAALAETQGQILHRQNAMVIDRLGKADAAISALENKLDHIERRFETNRPEKLTQKVTALSWQLDRQSRLTARNAHSSLRYFELMTAKIEAFAVEIRQLRTESSAAREQAELLPKLGQDIERLVEERLRTAESRAAGLADHPAVTAMNQRLDEAISRFDGECDAARIARESVQADMETLRQSIRQLEKLGRSLSASIALPASTACRTGAMPSHDPNIRSNLIASARQALRGEQDGSGMERYGNRFLRTAASDDI